MVGDMEYGVGRMWSDGGEDMEWGGCGDMIIATIRNL